ncbi:CotH kinase family protein [Flavobacterium sp.]|uniref:CotH kinase family protein n=1 Tax=Flavobacterium sp. TaxID=239 RepID=UPI00286C2BDD|nr:CotH kinase family protein [Flavobacterium sp.]
MKKSFLFLLFITSSFNVFSQSFYDINTIQDIRIVFAESNWDALLDAQAGSTEDYIPAQSVTINGTVFNNVGVKYKGNSTYNATRVKNPFHIELDTYQNQDYQGYTDIKLSNVYFDPSFLREPLSYSILRQYMDAPLCNYANVYVNGTLIGLYVSSESISKKFVDNHFYSNNNALFKCNPIGGAGPGSSSYPNLAYLGTNITSYQTAYEMNSDAGWEDLVSLTNTLSNDITNIESVLDVDRAIWMLAFDNVLVNIDSYIGTFKQNYYLYKDDNGRFNAIVWDLNMSFGVFTQTGTVSLANTTAKKQMTHLLHSGDAAWPLVQKLLAVPKYKRMYLAHFRTILEENFSNNSYLTTAQSYQNVINAAVQADPNKAFTYAQYQSNLTTDMTGGMNPAPGITNLMNGRYTYLSALTDFTNTRPTISAIAPTVAVPLINSDVFITANVINTNTNGVYLGYRSDKELPFTKVLMYDDGLHGDGASGDNVYGASMNMSNAFMQYYIYAENNNVGMFSPERAEHEFYSLYATYPTINPGDLVVNEIMAQNTATVMDQDGEYEDWVELYNNTDTTLSLDNLFMTDTAANLIKWQFPTGITIEPHGYLTVWADEDGAQIGLHANFKLSSGGESVLLAYANGTIIETVDFGAQTANFGYARVPNGTGNFVIQSPTFNTNNESLSVSSVEFKQNLTVFPNPTNENLNLQNKFPIDTVEIFNLQGQLLYTHDYQNQNQIAIDMTDYSKGLYMVIVNKNTSLKIVKN